jgi:hypothetical protein
LRPHVPGMVEPFRGWDKSEESLLTDCSDHQYVRLVRPLAWNEIADVLPDVALLILRLSQSISAASSPILSIFCSDINI